MHMMLEGPGAIGQPSSSNTAVVVAWASLVSAHSGLVGLLDDVELARMRELDLPADRARFLVGVALLRTVAGEACGQAASDLEIDRRCSECGRPHGRPRIRSGPQVSVSHSGTLVVVALSWETQVGIDVQRIVDVQGTDATEWVRGEARFKAHPRASPVVVLDVEPPQAGYVAAVATVGAEQPRLTTVRWELSRSPGDSPPPGE